MLDQAIIEFYADSERREQQLIVEIQKLMIKNSELKKGAAEDGRKKTSNY